MSLTHNTPTADILIVEDHDAIRVLIVNALKKQAYQLTTKRDGIEGMAWLMSGNIPSLIILDNEMPRLQGRDFVLQIKNSGLFREVPIIVVSATEDVDTIIDLFNLGIWAFIQKPFDPNTLRDKVKSILQKNNNLLVA
jgi:DNA-binding response OmpR family regulator